MCKWCSKIDKLQENMKNSYASGWAIGETIKFKPWSDTDKIEIQMWYDKDYGMKDKEFLLELSYSGNNDDNGIRLIAPMKYCPNCGRNLNESCKSKK